MSRGWGIDTYGIDYYGYSQPQDYSVAPFTAQQSNYGVISLRWNSPNTTTWKLLNLVRSTYGYPSTPADGISIQTITPAAIRTNYDDLSVSPGVIYYYSMFISLEAAAYASGTTYNINAVVLSGGTYWLSLQNSNTGHTPAVGSSFWQSTSYKPVWYPAGFTATMALVNHGYSTLLYNRTPQPYKILTSDTFANSVVDNQPLQNYLSLFGFSLDILKTSYDSYLKLNNPDTVSAASLDILGRELGITTDYLSSPQQRRQRIKNASVNYRMKGEPQSIHNLVAELAGWDSVITSGPNRMLSGDQASFEHPSYSSWNANVTYFVNQIIQYNGYNYKNLVQSKGVAQQPTGANTSNTWWQVQDQIVDTTTLLNPGTGKFSTWTAIPLAPVTSSITGVISGLPHPTNTSINNWNALGVSQLSNFNTPEIDIYSTCVLNTPNWSSSNNYVVGNYVKYTVDGFYYKALKPSGPATPYLAVTPGTDNLTWKAIYYLTTDTPNNIADGIPIPQLRQWNATTAYKTGTQVQFFGIVYQAATNNINSSPSGNYYSNTNWTFIQVPEYTYCESGYFGRLANNTTSTFANTNPNFLDNTGTAITNTTFSTGAVFQGAVSRFVNDYPDLVGTTDADQLNTGNTNTWVAFPATATMWKTSYGMASVNQTLAGTTTYVLARIHNGTAPQRVFITFASDYVDTAHKTHGILYNWKDNSNFLYATRKTLYQVVAGVETALASWTRLVNGDRMAVELVGTTLSAYKYARDGKGTLVLLGSGTITPATFGTDAGMIQKYSSSGAL